MTSSARILITALILSAGLPAQRLIAYDATGPGLFAEVQPLSVFGPPSPVLASYPTAPPLAPPIPSGTPPGDSSFDAIAGLNYYTNGLEVAATPTSSYPPAGPVPAPIAIPASVLSSLLSPVTGLAVDPYSGTLYLGSSFGVVVGVAPTPGMPVVVPPFLVPGSPGAVMGLEWDSLTGSLLAVDTVAAIYKFLPGGAPVEPTFFPTVSLPAIPADVAIDKTDKLNAIGERAIYVASGGVAFDVTLPAPVAFSLGTAAGTVGLAFHQYPAQSEFGPCSCSPFIAPEVGVTGPMMTGNTSFATTLSGISPSSLVLFAIDFTFAPAFPLLNATGCGAGIIPASPTLITSLAVSSPTGVATYPLALGVPAGFGPLYSQAFMLSACDPAGFLVAPMQRIVVCDG